MADTAVETGYVGTCMLGMAAGRIGFTGMTAVAVGRAPPGRI